jgi:hypothetical protein
MTKPENLRVIPFTARVYSYSELLHSELPIFGYPSLVSFYTKQIVCVYVCL